MPKGVPEGCVSRIGKIFGTVFSIKGLHRKGLFATCYPKCVVKGIRPNSNLVDIYETDEVEAKTAPVWEEEFKFDCLKLPFVDDFVGLKFFVISGDDFLGGVDVDISELASGQDVGYELELEGIQQMKQTTGMRLQKARKKPRIFLEIRVERVHLPRPGSSHQRLMASLQSYQHPVEITGRILKTRRLKGNEQPMCCVRAVLLSGMEVALFSTPALEAGQTSFEGVENSFNKLFKAADMPVLLVFDLYQTDGSGGVSAHLGSAFVPVADIREAPLSQTITPELREGRMAMEMPTASLMEKWLDRSGQKVGRGADMSLQHFRTATHFAVDKKKEGFLSKSLGGKEHARNVPTCVLLVELLAERVTLPMPYLNLLDNKVVVEEIDVGDDDPELLDVFSTLRARRLVLHGEDRILMIHGRVRAAADLISPDILDKSDPYVVVEAVTNDSDTIFMYRTRYIKDTLNPTWNEAFLFPVPEEMSSTAPVIINKLLFSVWDSDEGELSNRNGEDDFLGRCNVDVSSLRTGDILREELPLLGVHLRPGGSKPSGGFRRYSTISVEVRVERRIHRAVEVQQEIDPALLQVDRHVESRKLLPPEFRGYMDLSQEAIDPPDKTAGGVLTLRETGALAHMARTRRPGSRERRWLQARQHVPRGKKQEQDQYKQLMMAINNAGADDDEHEEGHDELSSPRWRFDDVNRKPPVQRTTSLPSLKCGTRFGDRYAERTAGLFDHSGEWQPVTIPPWLATDGAKSEWSLRQRPSLSMYTLRDRN
mmetsp:Transcript_15546/g.27648  ORF Transcript_15546/g.27648 Transcript_15546/m.27648 type:complete len:767 (+) Transcript_15546:183-2483(+)